MIEEAHLKHKLCRKENVQRLASWLLKIDASNLSVDEIIDKMKCRGYLLPKKKFFEPSGFRGKII
jgi:hypothetical protein